MIEATRAPNHALEPVPSTLRIPLAARALGDAMFPEVAVGDAHAVAAFEALGEDPQPWLDDAASVYGVLARTLVFRSLAHEFFRRHPEGQGVNLGCGLSHYAQWLDTGRNHWMDTDLEPVLALRRRVLPEPSQRLTEQAVDLRRRGWWNGLGLPRDEPAFVMCEGVLMYLEPAQVRGVFAEIDAHAAPGTEFVFDTICWLAVGRADWHASVKRTGAQFRWGPRSIAEVVSPHRRLRIASEHSVMDGFSWPQAMVCPAFRWLTGGPFYGLTRVVVA